MVGSEIEMWPSIARKEGIHGFPWKLSKKTAQLDLWMEWNRGSCSLFVTLSSEPYWQWRQYGKSRVDDGEKHVLKPNILLDFSVTWIDAFSFLFDSVWIGFAVTCMRKYFNWNRIRYNWRCLANITSTFFIYRVPIIHWHGSWSWDLIAQLEKGTHHWNKQQHKPMWGKC